MQQVGDFSNLRVRQQELQELQELKSKDIY